jgi:proteasome lid subunit RPN8/RPN11
MVDQLRRCLPAEGCGFLGGRENRPLAVYPVENALDSPTAYRMEPAAQLAALLAIEAAGWEPLAIYHSHPNGPQRPSASDIGQWRYPDSVMLIVSFADGERPSIHGYRLAEGMIIEQEIIISA